jgi:putative acetyltransferase
MINTIEVPTPHDYIELVALWEASVRATHDFLKEEDIQFFKPLILKEYLKAVQLYCIKDSNGAISGFMGLSPDAIEMLFIHPDSRGKGIGKLLVEYALKEYNSSKVDVNEQNPQAIGFYEKMGFKVVGRSPLDGLGKPYPILHMELAS